MSNICVKPWTSMFVWTDHSRYCCFTDYIVNNFEPFRPTTMWNGQAMQQARKMMLENGYKAVCPRCPFTYRGTIKQQLQGELLDYKYTKITELEKLIETGSLVVPEAILISVSSGTKCNSACKMCWFRQKLPFALGRITDTHYIKRVIESGSTQNVSIGGGDLFACTDEYIDSVLESCGNAFIQVITNARGLTMHRISKYIQSNRIHSIRISLETVNPEMYCLHTGGNQGTLLTCLRFLDGKNVCWYSCVITKWTYKGLVDLVNFAKETHVKRVSIKPYIGNALETIGYADANIFGAGFTEEIYQEMLGILAQVKALCKMYEIYVDDLDLVRRRLDERRSKCKS